MAGTIKEIECEDGMVKMEFLGKQTGPVTFLGLYQGANTDEQRFTCVAASDVEKLARTGQWSTLDTPASRKALKAEAKATADAAAEVVAEDKAQAKADEKAAKVEAKAEADAEAEKSHPRKRS